MLESYRIFVGHSDNYKDNTECKGGPYMSPEEPTTYGAETWCNLAGQYVSIIRDFSMDSYEYKSFNICELDILGEPLLTA